MPYTDARSPETLVLTITSSDGFDMTTVNSLELATTRPDNTTVPWSWGISSATQKVLVVGFAFDSSGTQASAPGDYVVSGWVVSPSSRRRIAPTTISFRKYG